MQITIIGAGAVGSILGSTWSALGHQITFGVRNPDSSKVKKVIKNIPGSCAVSMKESVEDAVIIVLAIPWKAVQEIGSQLGSLKDKIIIDTINPLNDDLSDLLVKGDSSAAESIAQQFPQAHIVKALNTVGTKCMAKPQFGMDASIMLMAGDDVSSKEKVKSLIEEMGFQCLDAGPLKEARHLENLALLWIKLAFHQGLGMDFAFKLLQR